VSELPLPQIDPPRRIRISAVWLVPLLAVVLSAWLVYRHYAEQGPHITIAFERAGGLKVGVTPIKHKEVTIGQVTDIDLAPDLARVLVHAQLRKDLAPWLTHEARFWIVQPRVSVSGVSGLSTLVSGAYIEADFSARGPGQKNFIGLEEPPLTPGDAPGLRLRLYAQEAESIQVGAPVFYRKMPVGQVESRGFAPDSKGVMYQIFVRAPYHVQITEQTRFWNVSGIQASLTSEGVNVQTGSLESLLIGGVAFANLALGQSGNTVAENTLFSLYSTREEAEEQWFSENSSERLHYVLNFRESVRGLKPGAPVEYLGVKVGRVVSFRVEYEQSMDSAKVPVVVALEPERIGMVKQPQILLAEAIRRGLSAQLQTGNLLTGQRYIVLKFVPHSAPQFEISNTEHPEIPTIPSELNQLTDQVYTALNQFNTLPLAELLHSAQQTIKHANALLSQRDTIRFPGQLNQTLRSVDSTLRELKNLSTHAAQAITTAQSVLDGVSPYSPLYYEATVTLQNLQQTAQAIYSLADALERNPGGIFFGQ